MNLNLPLLSFALAVVASFSLNVKTDAQESFPIGGYRVPMQANSYGQAVMQQSGQPGCQQASFNLPGEVGFTQFMNQRNQSIGSPVDYTPELIGTYGTDHNCSTASRIGVATVTDFALGQGRHSPLAQDVAQVSYFQPVARQSSVGTYNVSPDSGFGYHSPAAPVPQIFGDSNIGGGRSIATAFMDPHWTRMVLAYGGFGNSADSGGDVFGGQASADLGVVGIDIGRRHSKFMRSSIDFTYRGGDVDFAGANVGEVKVYSLMKNFHLDLAQRGQFRPYIGVGIGAGVLDADATFGGSSYTVQDEVSFAFQAMGGVAHNISELAAIYAEYRFFTMSDVDVATGAGTSEGNFASHDVLFGLRFGF